MNRTKFDYILTIKEIIIMNIGYLIFIILGGGVGIACIIYMVVSLIATIIYKIYRKIRYNISLYN